MNISKRFRKMVVPIMTIFFIIFVAQACSNGLSIEESKQIDITSKPKEFLKSKTIRDKTVLQSFAFDNVNEHIYVLQVMGGNQKVGEETVSPSWSQRTLNGDLTLTQLDIEGNQLGYMHLKGFGHGVAMGIEMEDDDSYIWMETDAEDDGKNGWGSKLTRFQFKDQSLLDSQKDDLETYTLITNADRTTVNIDQAYELLTMRYRIDDQIHFAVFPLDEVKEGDYEPLYEVQQPDDIKTFQGFASHGHYLYLLEGNSYEDTNEQGNTYITTVDLRDGEVIEKEFVDAALDLSFREPEGMGMSIPDLDHPENAVLNFGFASEHEDYPFKLINIFNYDTFIED